MPGSKRRMDEDTWLIFQSKKTKTSLLADKIFESTLAKLRHGARTCFNPEVAAGPPSWAGSNSPRSGSSTSENVSNQLSPDNVSARNNQLEGSSCMDCQSRNTAGQRSNTEKCFFCDQFVCHVSPCGKCGDSFCYKCYIKRYEDPSSDAVTCYSCL